jgi:hypothetical protein
MLPAVFDLFVPGPWSLVLGPWSLVVMSQRLL